MTQPVLTTRAILSVFFVWIAAPTEASEVRAWEEPIVIPTYAVGEPEANPRFRIPSDYQGTDHYIYPYRMLDKLTDTKSNQSYKGLFLENEYLKLCVLPELGGRLYFAEDKTNQYDFVYRNRVIKPALVGMAGAWCSGGIEWNLPHHHRISAHMPMAYRLTQNLDGSRTIWVGEYEKRHGMKCSVGLTLRPGRSCVEVDFRLLNVTPLIHSMLCFANLAVHANENYQVIFPPDVERAVFHAKVDFADWPIARQVYQRIDFSRGVDVSWWKNTSSPTSFFAWGSKMDFVAGIDHGRKSGTVMVGNHNIWPGKKMWNWGNNDVARLWDKMLTDNDGPYVELMMGAYSDNQPDYSWIDPQSARTAKMYFYPCRQMTSIKNATKDFAINLEVDQGKALVEINATAAQTGLGLILTQQGRAILEEEVSISPNAPYAKEFSIPSGVRKEDVKVALRNADGRELIAYQPTPRKNEPVPPVYADPKEPRDISSVEELYLRGLRLEQFYNPRLSPLPYYLEALRREPADSRVNTQLGIYYLKRYRLDDAIRHLQTACDRVTMNHTRAKDSESWYYLGVALMQNGSNNEAYDALYRATWNDAFASSSYYLLAQIDGLRSDHDRALEHLDAAVRHNNYNVDAMNMKAVVLRHLERKTEAIKSARRALEEDPLNCIALRELEILNQSEAKNAWLLHANDELAIYLETASRYARAGFFTDAIEVLRHAEQSGAARLCKHPLLYYHLGYYCYRAGDKEVARRYFTLGKNLEGGKTAAALPLEECFPYGMESFTALAMGLSHDDSDPRAHDYLGSLLCDLDPQRAEQEWKRAVQLDGNVAAYHRNLAFVLANAFDRMDEAVKHIERAIKLNPDDPLYLAEADTYHARLKTAIPKRYELFQRHELTTEKSDGAKAREVKVQVAMGLYDKAIQTLSTRHFRSFEQVGFNIHVLWVDAHVLRGRERLEAKQYDPAIEDFLAALEFPWQLETARDSKAVWAYYWLGVSYKAQGDAGKAKECFWKMIQSQNTDAWTGDVWPEVLHAQACAYQELGEKGKAEAVRQSMIHQGQALLQEKPHAAAIMDSVERRSAREFGLARGHVLIALARIGQGFPEDAHDHLDNARKLAPELFGPGAPIPALLADAENND